MANPNFQGMGAGFDAPSAPGSRISDGQAVGDPAGTLPDESDHASQASLSLDGSPPAVYPTHDISRARYHMKGFDRFIKDLRLRAFPNTGYSSRYRDVRVLLIRWEVDVLGVESEIEELHSVFRDIYHFHTEEYHIPLERSHLRLNQKILRFVDDYEDEENLLIVYYGGHGTINRARQSAWTCDSDPVQAMVEWSAIQTCLEMAKSDVLLLLDCCAAASAAPQTERPTNMKETIAACGFEDWAPVPSQNSFTSTLIDVLKEWAPQLPFSAAMLHSEVLHRIKQPCPTINTEGRRVEPRRTPIYVVSSPSAHTSSIILGRLVDDDDDDNDGGSAGLVNGGGNGITFGSNIGVFGGSDSGFASSPGHSSSHNGGAVGSGSGPSPGLGPTSAWPTSPISDLVQAGDTVSRLQRIETLTAASERGQRKLPHVLLTLALEEDQQLDAASCGRWLKQFPMLAKYCSVESVYHSYSTLVILSVPVVLWNLLPERLAVSFIGYVTSRNLAPQASTAEQYEANSSAADAAQRLVAPIPISTKTDGSTSRNRASNGRGGADHRLGNSYVTQSRSSLGSLDSGYDSGSVAGSMSSTRLNSGGSNQSSKVRPATRGHGHGHGPSPGPGLRRARSDAHYTLLGQYPSPLATSMGIPGHGNEPRGRRPRNLIVSVIEAHVNSPRSGLACVLSYGYEIKRSQEVKGTTPSPRWDKNFHFEVQKSPMFYHLRLSVWGADMSELVGEVQLDLVSVVQRGKLPKMGDLQILRSEGKETGRIHISLRYLDAAVGDQQDTSDHGNSSGRAAKDSPSRIETDEYRVW